MVKRNSAKKPKRKQPAARPKSTVMVDGAAADHIRLMADPCMGKMVYPSYPTVSNGSLVRLRGVVSIGTGASETCGLFHWSPGTNEFFANGAATNTTAFTPNGQSNFSLLTTGTGVSTGNTFRCVAACARLIYNGSEQNRGGIIYAGNTTTAAYGSANPTTVQQVIGMLPYTCRTPSKYFEILWVPDQLDTVPYTDSTSGVAGISQGISSGAVTIGFTGMPSAVGITMELTGVYEVQFASGNNQVVSTGPPASNTPWNQVLRGFWSFVKNSTVVVDGVKSAYDYVGPTGVATIGANIGRMAIGYL